MFERLLLSRNYYSVANGQKRWRKRSSSSPRSSTESELGFVLKKHRPFCCVEWRDFLFSRSGKFILAECLGNCCCVNCLAAGEGFFYFVPQFPDEHVVIITRNFSCRNVWKANIAVRNAF